jgi:hypothetical protein
VNDVNPRRWQIKEENEGIDKTNVPLPPIQLAFLDGNEQVAELLLPYLKSEKAGEKALRWVLESSEHPGVLKLIIDLGLMDINAPVVGETPLFTAYTLFNTKAVTVLLEAGADPKVGCREVWIDDVQFKGGDNVLHGLAAPRRYRWISPRRGIPEDRMEECFALILAAAANGRCHASTSL